ncbi:fibrocystin [Crotalus adamanteus]|uniref:Fibrocystin n=1 Tax=Crotalus adamanteus TaxID=8729 RepID=A0AAW1CAK4_CROAD
MPFFFKTLLLFVAVTLAKLIMEPKSGSLGGGTWITINFDALSHSVNWSQPEVALLNPELHPVLCDVMPVSFFMSTVKCQTRSSPQEGLYHLLLSLNEQSISNLDELYEENCTFQFSIAETPVVFQVNPPYGVPGNVIQIYGRILAQDYETYNFSMDFIDGPVILEAENDGWITICSLASEQTRGIYPIHLDNGLGTVACRVEGNYIGSHNVSFSVYNKGKSIVHKDAWLISAKQELFLYQTFSDISSVSPATGSLGGGTDLTITGDFFDTPMKVTAAGTPCQIKHISPQKIICTTGAADNNRTFSEIKPGNRGLIFELWDGSDTNLSEVIPGYSWQIVPNASSPYNFLPEKQKLFSARLRGFFMAPETNNYTFWIQADGKASLYLSLSDDPRKKVEVVSISSGTADWSAFWKEDWFHPRKPKSEKYELIAGTMYYLEAVHNGISSNNGMSVGVQLHHTWLNPDVVSTYCREKYRIQANAIQLPEIQMLILSGRGRFSLVWDNVTSNPMSTNVTADQLQHELEELLSVKCEIEPSSANIFLQTGFEQNTENLVNGGVLVSWTEPFCGRFSNFRPKGLIKTSQLIPPYDVTTYTHLCFAYKGYMSNTFYIAVSYSNTFLDIVKKHVTCQWNLKSSPESWKFICINLWRDCLYSSEFLNDLPKNSSVFLHQVDVEAPTAATETLGWFFIDEIIVSDQDLFVFQKEPRSTHPHGNLIESVLVAGIPPIFNVSFFVANYHKNLPLLSLRGGMPLKGSEETDQLLMSMNETGINLTVQRIQGASPPLGGTFQIHLPNIVIPGIPVSISANHLRSLLQNYSDNFTAQYINTSDFFVSKISQNSYQSIWTLTWTSMIGDLPNFIRVSDENLTGLIPTIISYVVIDGGVFIDPIFGDMLATPNNITQVVVRVNDIPANCSGSCTFQYLTEMTPLVNSIDYSTDDTEHIIVHIIGSGFTADHQSLLIEANNLTCKILINASGENSIFLKITPRLTSVEPLTASEIGGLTVTLSGSGLDGINTVLFGSQSCPINFNASNAVKMECRLPPRRGGEATVHLTLISERESTVFANAFTYDSSLNPCIVSMNRNKSGITGGQLLEIGISSFSNYTPFDVKVKIGDTAVQIQTVADHGISLLLPSLAEGLHRLSIFLHHLPLNTSGLEPFIQYVTEIFRIEPCCGSFLGGTLLTISGIGFSYSPALVLVLIDFQPCQFLTIMVSKVRQMEDMYVFIGGSSCTNVTSNGTSLQCVLPQLPTGEHNVTGGIVQRGWASSSLVFTSVLTVITVENSHGNLDGGEIYIHGNGFSPGNTSVSICDSPCEMLNVTTTTDLSCLTGPLNASLAVLCTMTYSAEENGEDCKAAGAALIQCDIQIKANADVVTTATPFLFFCDDLAYSSLRSNKTSINSSNVHFFGLLLSPKVERDEVLIYNSSCNITMETEAEMECEGPNQPITAKITEIWKNWGQNTQNTLQIQFCGRWSKNMTWLNGHPPQDGDNVIVERGHILLLDTNTSVLNMLHVKGGKLAFIDSGSLELHAHSILVSDGGELQIGSPRKPFCDMAHIHLHGSTYSEGFFPYGVKFLAVRNGILSMHGCVPKITVTYLKSAAYPNETKLDLIDFVDWKPGDEVVVCGGSFEGAQKKKEILTIKEIKGTELYITSPLRYSYAVTEKEVLKEHLTFRAVVALLSRNLVIQGNVTSEKISHLQLCKATAVSGDNSNCLYKRTERKPGSQDMGGIVIVESYYDKESLLHLAGVQFHHVGQAFQRHFGALTLVGNAQMTKSYMQHCVVLDSFAQGISLSGISDFKIENNTFYNIMGHGIKIGAWNGNNKIRHNTIIGLVGTDGLSNTEVLSPAGIYIQSPDNLIESNMVCGTGHGYFFHLPPSRLGEPVKSFSNNVAHSCSRYGLLIHPAYHPQKRNNTEPVIFQNFSAWQCKGGVQIISTSNLQLWNFHISSCKDFGINIVESLGNTSVVNSLLIGHFHEKDESCMLTGLKTPQKHELLISRTTFMNFDSHNCIAITTCSGCYQGQGGFPVRTDQVLFLNAPNWLSFPFPHCAILKDLDGSLTGQPGSQILPSLDILPDSCRTIVNASQAVNASCCFANVTFHRMSLSLKFPIFSSNLTVTNSHNKVITVNYVSDTLSNANGWMGLLLDQEIYTLSFSSPLLQRNLQYIATFDNFAVGNYLLLEHEGLPVHSQVTVLCGRRQGLLLQAIPSHRHHKACDSFFNKKTKKLTYLVTGKGLIQVTFKVEDIFPLSEPGPVPSFSPPIFRWSLAESWNDVTMGWGGYNKSIPSADEDVNEDVIILPNRTILVDMNLPPLRGLYIQGTLEFSLNTSHLLSVACIVIAAGGVLKVGTLQHPLEERRKVHILLRASERVNCDRLNGLNVGPGTIGVFGKLQMHSVYTKKSWTYLGNDVAPGNERVMVQDHLDWHQGDSIVVSSSSYEAHQAEIITLEKVNNRSIRIRERLLHRHIGYSHRLEDGQWILLAAEVGLLTRNIQIKSDMDCIGRLLVRPWDYANQDAGVLQLSNHSPQLWSWYSSHYNTSFDCIKDRIQPLSANETNTDRAPRNPWRGRIGMLWPSFTSDCNWWPDAPWHKIRNYSIVLGVTTLQDITFDGFRKSCYTGDQDTCIMTNPGHGGILHLITSEQTRMLHISEQNMFYFHPLQTRVNEPSSSGNAICGNSRKALFKDLDGSALGLDSPVSVFQKSELDWEQACQDAGIYREEGKCILKPLSNVYFSSVPTTENSRNGSRPTSWSCLYVCPYSISVWIQPSNGVVERPLLRQPQIIFLDKKGRRIVSLGFPSKPWFVTAYLKNHPEIMLKGNKRVMVQDGQASFQNLLVSSSCSDCHFIFKVTSPPGAALSVESNSFTVSPVAVSEKAAIIFTALLCSVASMLVLGCVVICWLKKSKKNRNKLRQSLKNKKCPQIKENQVNCNIHQHSTGKENEHSTSMREDMKLCEELTEEPLKKLHQGALNIPLAGTAKEITKDHWFHKRESTRESVEFQELHIKELNEWKKTKQHIIDYVQHKEMKEEQFIDQKYKRHKEMPVTRSEEDVRGKQEVTVS